MGRQWPVACVQHIGRMSMIDANNMQIDWLLFVYCVYSCSPPFVSVVRRLLRYTVHVCMCECVLPMLLSSGNSVGFDWFYVLCCNWCVRGNRYIVRIWRVWRTHVFAAISRRWVMSIAVYIYLPIGQMNMRTNRLLCECDKLSFFSPSFVSSIVADDMDQDDCDETSDIDDRASETDSKKDGSRGTSRGSSNEGKSQGNSSKPRR